jgi:Holliday junction resolvase
LEQSRSWSAAYGENGTEYEKAIHDLLVFTKAFTVTVIDDGKRQNVPDLLVRLGKIEALIECESATKNPALINKEDAWAVVQTAADYDQSVRRITLGKSAFDERSKLESRRFNRSDADRERRIRRSCGAGPAKEPDARRIYGLDNNACGF